MKFTKVRTLIAAGTIGVVGLTGIAAAGVAGAQTTDSTTQAAQGRGAFIASLSAEQKQCLQDNGVTRPDHRLTKDERQAAIANLRSAADTCGVALPDGSKVKAAIEKAKAVRAEVKALTPEQKQCLKSNGVAKPDHKLSRSEWVAAYNALESAAQTCGIALS